MDSATITFHQTMLRLGKGMLKAYETWIEEQTITATAETLKQVRQNIQSVPSRLDKSVVKE